MGNVIDVSERGEHPAVLTDTSAGGLLGGRLLHDDPLLEYLGDAESPRYVLRNKKRGLVVERGGVTEHVEPHSDYQALWVATDVRILVVVGQEPADASTSIPLSEVVSVDVDDGVLGGELAVTTAEDERFVFPCRGSLAEVAADVDEGTQAWARAYTLLDTAEGRMEEATDLREDGAFEDALAAVDDAREAVTAARERLAAYGEGALASIESEADVLEARIAERRRDVHEAHGRATHEAAREYWENREYDTAYDSFAEADAAFERAQALREDEDVAERHERLREEWSNLRVAPVAYAEAMAAEATATDRPGTAAQCWEVALERYRDVYALDWGREEPRFDVEPERVRERVLETLESAIDCRIQAAAEALAEAEALREDGQVTAARDRLETALAGVERAVGLADELRRSEDEALLEARNDLEAALADVEQVPASP